MYDTPVGHAVRESLKQVSFGRDAEIAQARDVLKDRVYAAVDELKAMGWPIERILVRLKEVADEVGFPPRFSSRDRDRDVIIRDILRWCLDRYYSVGA